MLNLVQKPSWNFLLKQGFIRNVKWNYQEGMSISGLCSLPRFSRKSQLGFCTRFSTSAAVGPIVHHFFNDRYCGAEIFGTGPSQELKREAEADKDSWDFYNELQALRRENGTDDATLRSQGPVSGSGSTSWFG